MQVKIFSSIAQSVLEEEINEFLKENNGKIKSLDFKYSTSMENYGITLYSVLLTYYTYETYKS